MLSRFWDQKNPPFGLEVNRRSIRANQKSPCLHENAYAFGETDSECLCLLPGEIINSALFLLNRWSYYLVIINSANNHKCSNTQTGKMTQTERDLETTSHAQSRKWQLVSVLTWHKAGLQGVAERTPGCSSSTWTATGFLRTTGRRGPRAQVWPATWSVRAGSSSLYS